MASMTAKGEIELSISFSPVRAPSLPAVLAHARAHADHLQEVTPGTHRATFVLDGDPRRYARASELLWMVASWRSTLVEVDGEPAQSGPLKSMLWCARDWLERQGRCAAWFPSADPPPKCRLCPLYDPEWALEAWGRLVLHMVVIDGVLVVPEILDYVPKDWSAEA
jgi:hypothetical protein